MKENSTIYYKSCQSCGRPQTYCKGECCGKPQGCQCQEYGPKACGCIRQKAPECPYEAVIPSVTVESISNLKDLADCFVHVSDINTTFYIDDKHRIMTTWAGLVSVDDYDFEANPLNLRGQIAYDAENNKAAIYDKQGANYIFQISDIENDYVLLENKPAINGVTLEGNKSLNELDIPAIEEVALIFDTVADMKVSTNLVAGSYARTLGFHSINDGGGAFYYISDSGTADEASIIAVGDLKAHLVITGDIKPEQFGAYGDGTHNDSTAFIKCLDYVKAQETTLNNEVLGKTIVLTNDYLLDKISIPQGMAVVRIIGKKARIRTGGFTFNGSTGWKVRIEGIIFDHCETPIDFDYRNLEYGRYEIVECIFRSCTGVCVNIERRSCQVTIERCTFRGCAKSVYVNDVDMFIFKDNWLECNNENPWGDNHYDIEQYAPNEGTMIIENNMFIPGYSQTGTNPCWIKAGRNAVIKNNRFSGENATIHPLIVIYDNVANFNVNSTIYPIVDFVENPIVTGATPILVDGSARGTINVKNNSGWAGGLKIMSTASPEAATALESLDYRFLTINFVDNGGRTFNFKNDYGISLPAAYKPSVDTVLNRFIKNKPMYQEEYNYELKSSVANYILDIEYCTTDLKRVNTIVISGTVNKNPAGTDYYEPFIGLLTLERYYDTELRYRGHLQIITKNNQSVSFDVLVNGQAYITALPSGENVKFTVSGSGNARPIFKSVELLHFTPITNKLSN